MNIFENFNPETLSDEQLKEYMEKLKTSLTQRNEEKIKKAKDSILKIAEEAGIDVFFEIPESENKSTKIPIKYRNPSNLNETWTGRGKRPNWIQNLLSQGKKLEDFEV